MIVRRKRVVDYLIIIILMLTLVNLASRLLIPKGAVPLSDIVSYCTGDATNDGVPEFLAISGDGKIDTGERHGQLLLVCDASAKSDLNRLGYIPPEKIQRRIDLSAIKPIKVQLGDVNGDYVDEVAICFYKTAEFHPVMAKRPFFFDLVDGNLIPVWLGSRLSRPFDDYILYDIDADAIDEIISVEQLENGGRVIAVYNWEGFGFEMLTQSEEFDGKLRIGTGDVNRTSETGEIVAVRSDNSGSTRLRISLNDGNLVCTIINNE